MNDNAQSEQQSNRTPIQSEREFWIAIDSSGVVGELKNETVWSGWDCDIAKKDNYYVVNHCDDYHGWATSRYATKEHLRQALVQGDLDSDLSADGYLVIPAFGQKFWSQFKWG